METKRSPDKVYKFKFSPLLIALAVLGLVLCAAGLGLTTWQLAEALAEGGPSVYECITYALMYLVSVLLAVLISAMLIRSQYVITDSELIMRFGLIRQKYDLKKIFSVHLFKGADKLAVYFDDFRTNYIVIVVKNTWYDDFIRELTARNERIAFTFSSAEEEEEFKKKK